MTHLARLTKLEPADDAIGFTAKEYAAHRKISRRTAQDRLTKHLADGIVVRGLARRRIAGRNLTEYVYRVV